MEDTNKSNLRKKLSHIRAWAQKDVQNARENITLWKSQKDTHNFFIQNIESIITDSIHKFFPPEVLMNFPQDGVQQILSSEVIYYNIIKWAHIDGISVVIGYQKVFENMIELYVTDAFRKFAKKMLFPDADWSHHMEKSLYNIINKNYILSLGRLYELILLLRENTHNWVYTQAFQQFLNSNSSLQKSLQDDDFFLQLQTLVEMQVFGYKRHSGFISEAETKSIRTLFVWDFLSQNCLIYKLAASQDIIW